MKKLFATIAIAFVLAIGTAAVMTVYPQPAAADGGGCSNC